MKKLTAGLLAMGLVLSMGSSTAVYAHGHGHGCSTGTKSTVCGYCSKGCTYVDADHDGICDNCDYSICQRTGKHKHSRRHCR